MKSNNQNNTDEIIRQMISNIRKEPINFPPNLTDIKKPKSYNKKKDSKRGKISTPRFNQPLPIEHVVDSAEINIDPPVENQHSFEGTIQTNVSPTDSIDQDTSDQQVYNEPVPIKSITSTNKRKISRSTIDHIQKDTSQTIEGNLRRSSRVAKLSAK